MKILATTLSFPPSATTGTQSNNGNREIMVPSGASSGRTSCSSKATNKKNKEKI